MIGLHVAMWVSGGGGEGEGAEDGFTSKTENITFPQLRKKLNVKGDARDNACTARINYVDLGS